jgi:hypothetical protein
MPGAAEHWATSSFRASNESTGVRHSQCNSAKRIVSAANLSHCVRVATPTAAEGMMINSWLTRLRRSTVHLIGRYRGTHGLPARQSDRSTVLRPLREKVHTTQAQSDLCNTLLLFFSAQTSSCLSLRQRLLQLVQTMPANRAFERHVAIVSTSPTRLEQMHTQRRIGSVQARRSQSQLA